MAARQGKDNFSLSALYWVPYLALQIAIARVLTIDFYDAFVFLRGARRLAGDRVGYEAYRPPMPSLLQLPLQKLLDAIGADFATRLWAPHLFEAFLSVCCIGAFYAYLRRSFSPRWAELGAALFSLNRLIVHYFSSALSDIPCALFLLLFFLLFDAKPETRRRQAWAAAALSACILCRWNMLAAPAIVGCGLLWRYPDLKPLRRLLRIACAVAAVFLLANILVYKRAFGIGPAAACRLLFSSLMFQFTANHAPEPARAYVDSLAASAGLIPLLFAGLGMILCAARKVKGGSFELTFLVLFLLIMTFVVGHKESRYLMPVLPLYYFFMLEALRYLYERLPPSTPRWARPGLVILLAAPCAVSAGREWLRFADPAYRDSILAETARAVAQAAGPESRVYWNGAAHSIVAERHVFTAGDPFYYLYHVPSRESLEYLLGRPVYPLSQDVRPGDVVVNVARRLYLNEAPVSSDENRIDIVKVAVGKGR